MPDDIATIIDQLKEEADFFKKAVLLNYLKTQKKMRIKDLSTHLDMKASYICHILRLNKLPEIIKDGYYSQLVSISHLFIIARLNNQTDMISAYEEVLAKNLTALQTDELIRGYLYKITSGGEYIPDEEITQHISRVKKINENLHVRIIQTRVKGKILIEIKGGLEQSSETIRKIIRKLDE